jgi:hypothetical protein
MKTVLKNLNFYLNNKRALVFSNQHSNHIKIFIDGDGDITLDTGEMDIYFENIDDLVKHLYKEKMSYEGVEKTY